MKKLAILLGLIISGPALAGTSLEAEYTYSNTTYIESQLELFDLEQDIFIDLNDTETIEVEDIQVCEIDETLEFESIDMRCSNLKVSDIDVIEIEEDIEISFDTKKYLPIGFNPYEGMPCEKQIVVVSLY